LAALISGSDNQQILVCLKDFAFTLNLSLGRTDHLRF
jgi:hypothetical protein